MEYAFCTLLRTRLTLTRALRLDAAEAFYLSNIAEGKTLSQSSIFYSVCLVPKHT